MALSSGYQSQFTSLFVIVSFLLFSCGSVKDSHRQAESWSIGDSTVIKTVEDMLYLSLCQNYRVIHGKEYLFYGNVLASNSIFLYDLESGDFVGKITLATQGPNNVGNDSYGFYAYNFDSIFVLSQRERVISLVDTTGTIFSQYKIPASDYPSVSTFLVTTSNPISFDQGILEVPHFSVIPTDGNKYSNETTLFSLSLEEEISERHLSYPTIYDQGYWREPSFLQANRTKTLDSGRNITGFGIDHFLRIGKDSYEVRSRYLRDFEPIDDRYNSKKTYANASASVYKQGYYSALITDHTNRRYFRVVVRPISPQDYAQGKRDFQFSIILLDQHLNLLDEKLLPSEIDAFKFFVRKGKLFMADKKAYEINEDRIVFREIIFDL
jgi:hypothetical protein